MSAALVARQARARARMADLGIDVLLLSVGADLPYLTGYEAMPLERLTMLVLPRDGEATLVVPELEAPRVDVADGGFSLRAWSETEDPVAIVAGLVPTAAGEPGPRERRGAAWPVYRAIASPIDWRGHRALWIGFWGGGDIDLLAFLLDEETGIEEASQRALARSRFDRMDEKLFQDRELPWIEMPIDYCRHLIEEAHTRNAATRTRLPLDYLAWRDRLGRPEKTHEQSLVYSVISAAEVRWDPRYLDSSYKLYKLPMFGSWLMEKSALGEFVRERAMAQRTGLVLPGRGNDARDQMVLDGAVQKLFDAKRRALLKRRLEEMAYLLWRLDQGFQARQALAAGIALEPADRPLVSHPFVREMVRLSLDEAAAEMEGERTREVRPGVQLYLP